MEGLKQRWQQLDEKCSALSVRERGILLGTLLTLVLVIWLQIFLTPIQEQSKAHLQSLQKANEELGQYAVQIEDLSLKLGENPNDPLRAEQKELQLQLDELAQDIEERLSNLMPPQKMASVMQSVLADYQGLKLIRARNLPVEPLKVAANRSKADSDDSESGPDQTAQESQDAVIFVHGFAMELEGEYFQTLRFLQRLEAMEGFYWQGFDYRVESYPKAKIMIQLNTLSLDEEWIGV